MSTMEKSPAVFSDGGAFGCRYGPGAIRTRDLLLRRQALYPAELRTLTREEKLRSVGLLMQLRPRSPHRAATRPPSHQFLPAPEHRATRASRGRDPPSGAE